MEQKTLSRATGENYRKNPQKTEDWNKIRGFTFMSQKIHKMGYWVWDTDESKSDKTQCHAQEYKVLSRLLV